MVKKLELTMFQREKNLTELIKDAKELKFNLNIIRNYKKQLKAVQKEIQELKDKKVKYKQSELIKKYYEEGKIKELGNGCYSVPSTFFIKGITTKIINEVLNQ